MQQMSSAHAQHQIGLHLIWCTKYRHPILVGAVEVILKEIFAETCMHYEWQIQALEIMPDHVHLFLQIDHQTRPVDVSATLKSISAVKLFTVFSKLKRRKFWGSGLWSPSTYYGTVGQVNEQTIKCYIEQQKQGSGAEPQFIPAHKERGILADRS